jgi:hypothetical protein
MPQKRQIYRSSNKYDHAAKLADEAVAEAVGRYLHDVMLERNEQQAGNELTQ